MTKDIVWLVYERPIIGKGMPDWAVKNVWTFIFWNWTHPMPKGYETHREKAERKIAEHSVRTQVPGSFYRNFRIEELDD